MFDEGVDEEDATVREALLVARLAAPEYAPIPEMVRAALVRYVAHRIPTGSGTRSILENRPVKEVVGRLDDATTGALRLILTFLHCNVPGDCYGSPERVAKWLAGRKIEAE